VTVSRSCVFEVNGEREVRGELWVKHESEGDVVTLDCTAEFDVPLTLRLTQDQHDQLGAFFGDPDILFWKITVLDSHNNIDTIVIVDVAREPELTLHLSISAGIESRHFETPLSDISSDLEAFFSE